MYFNWVFLLIIVLITGAYLVHRSDQLRETINETENQKENPELYDCLVITVDRSIPGSMAYFRLHCSDLPFLKRIYDTLLSGRNCRINVPDRLIETG
jgi:hypothetical protein